MNKQKGLSINQRNRLMALAFLTPNLLGFLFFMFIPIIVGIGMSLFDWNGATQAIFVGFKNYIHLFSDSKFINSAKVTLLYTVITVPITIVLSLLLAVLLTRKFKFQSLFRSAFFFPYISSIVAVAIVWQFLYNTELGPINQALRSFGIANPSRWLASKDSAIYAIAIMSTWKTIGYYPFPMILKG